MPSHIGVLGLLSLVGAAFGQSALPTTTASTVYTFLAQDGQTVRAGAICDGQRASGKVAVFVVGLPDPRGRVRLSVYDKARPGTYTYQNLDVGQGDAGASNVYYPLSRAGQPVGNLRFISSGVLDDPKQVLIPIFSSIVLGDERQSCRWEPGTRLLGFDGRRSVLITESAGGALTYQSFDFNDRAASDGQTPTAIGGRSRPSSKIVGGTSTKLAGGERFTFQQGGYTISVEAYSSGRAILTVSRGGRVLQSGALTGSTYAVRR